MTDTALLNLGAWSVQAGVLAGAAALLARFVPVDAPVVRYAWWRGVLLACLALPLLQPWQPPDVSPAELLSPDIGTAAIELPVSASAIPLSHARAGAGGPAWPVIVVVVLMTGALVRLAWLGAGLVRLRRIRRTGERADPDQGPDLMRALIDAGAEVRHVSTLRQPVTFGVVRPVVLLPDPFRRMPPDIQRAVLAHELWHVRRRDWGWSVGEEVLRALLWFHPAVWYLVSRIQCAREEVVDELSILSTNARRSYLEALLAFADEPAAWPAAPFIRRRQLFNRMMLISREDAMSPRRIVASCAGMAGVFIMAGWYGTLAFPLTAATAAGVPGEPDAQAQAQPRDPRPAAARPATSREQALLTATAAAPDNVKQWLELAQLQEDRGALAEAEATLDAAFAATSGSREVLMSQARFFARTGQFDKAMTALENAAARNPGDPAGHHLVATYYWEKAQKDTSLTPADKLMYIESGIRAEDRALSLRDDYIEALTYKNILLRMKGNLETDASRRQQLYAEADALRTRAIALSKQRGVSGQASGVPPGAPPPPPPPPPPSEHYQIDGQQAVRVGGEVKTPAKIHDVRPVYPEEAKQAGISGMIVMEVLIDTQGSVRSTFVKRSVPALDQAALDAVRQWRFTPTILDGTPVPVLMTVTVNFTLQ